MFKFGWPLLMTKVKMGGTPQNRDWVKLVVDPGEVPPPLPPLVPLPTVGGVLVPGAPGAPGPPGDGGPELVVWVLVGVALFVYTTSVP
jgi:hypothetical protein